MAVRFNVIVELDGRAVGMVSCTEPVDGEAELISMWVAPQARGRGVGQSLIEDVRKWATAQGARRLVLSVRTRNEPAIRLYTRSGFIDCGPAGASEGVEPEGKMVILLVS